jgi:threonine dehydratase
VHIFVESFVNPLDFCHVKAGNHRLMYTTTAPNTGLPLQAIYHARQVVYRLACRTPLVTARALSKEHEVRLKLETAQPIGAFKIRGAVNAISRLTEEARRSGVVCASTGNHGRAVALAAKRCGTHATVCLSRLVPQNKVRAIRDLGAEVRIFGNSQDEAEAECARLVAREGMAEIPPFDHPDVIAGQGTIGLELLEDYPELDTVVVPVSGGGLISGIACAVKAASASVRIIGVSMQRGAAMHASISAGHPIEVKEEPSLADSLGGGIGLNNRFTFAMVGTLVDEIVLVSEAEIAAAMRRLFLAEGWVAEGAGAIGLALLEEPHRSHLGNRVAIIVTGRNVDMELFRRVIDGRFSF